MDPAREKRKEEINKALAFIQSSLAYPDPDGYQDFLTRLVCNLLDEGNAFFRDGQLEQAVREFSEGLNVWSYAEAEEIKISEVFLESLYVNRAVAYHSMGEYEQGVLDCNSALGVCKDSRRALYKKALCLKELGKHKEAYDCTASYLLINPQDKQVNELAQELAIHLGLKIRKPYISAKISAVNTQNDNGITPVSFPSIPQPSFPSTLTGCSTPTNSAAPEKVDTIEDSELIGDDIDSLLDCVSTEPGTAEAVFSVPSRTSTCTQTVPSVLPAPTPQLPPAFFNSAINQLNSLDCFSGVRLGTSASTLDILDDLSTSGNGGGADASNLVLTSTELDALDGLDSLDDVSAKAPRAAAAAEEVIEVKTELDAGEKSLDELLDELDPSETPSDPSSQGGHVSKIRTKNMDRLDSLDSLDSFSSVDGVRVASPAFSVGGVGLDSLSDFSSTASHSAAAPVIRSAKNHYKEKENQGLAAVYNPLSSTHEFLQACSACYPREGIGIYTYVHKPDLVHNCKRDILLCRRKADPPSEWTRVRPLPNLRSFGGRFVLCRELLKSGELGVCKYGEKCTFAYNQLEIDVWTEERKGKLDRNLLFGTKPVKLDPVSSILRLLQEDKGTFVFLCQACYDSKPRIISKRCRDNQTICSNLDVRHNFDANKCLAFVVRTHNVNYRKVRPLSVLCHMDLCRQAIRYGCLREDECHYAHSVIELKTWKVQRDTGVSSEEIVRISTKYHDKQEQNSSKHKGNRLSSGGGGSKPGGGGGGAGKSLNMRMKFACGQCWLDGLISEPDKTLKHCGAKARHAWTKDRRVLLVKSSERSKWVQVRPLPRAKDFPVQYCMCAQILEKKKCTYSGVCTFAHSPEEKDMWMYMKNNDLRDMQQMYDMWMILSGNNRQADGAMATQPIPEEKYITMPTDYAEPMSGFHCRLCGKHSNSERQWQQHISTEKHKDRVFSCEGDEALTWSYRFPGTRFELCPKLDGSCPDGVSCDYAHSPEELQEWMERRDFLRQKLAKAREDMLIMPDEVDFGKYNFLLQD